VADGLCCACGRVGPLWTPARIIEAAREWAQKHGRSPTQLDWRKSEYDHPHYVTVVEIFGKGGWNRMLATAGLPLSTDAPGKSGYWTRERIRDAFVDYVARYGEWPTSHDWRYGSPENPHYSTVIAQYGSWRAGKLDAGWAEGSIPAPARCSECGTLADNETNDCATCRERHRSRTRRSADLSLAA